MFFYADGTAKRSIGGKLIPFIGEIDFDFNATFEQNLQKKKEL